MAGRHALILFLIGIVLFIPVFREFLQSGLVPRFPTLIVSTVFFLSSLLSLVCGFILDTVVKKNRQQFEVNLNLIRMLNQKQE